jgi:hypothetical protein
MTPQVSDSVPRDNPGAREIGFAIPENYNASRILFDNLAAGHGERLALTGPGGTRSSGRAGGRKGCNRQYAVHHGTNGLWVNIERRGGFRRRFRTS